MSKKITIRIDGIEDEWERLPFYINTSRSEFLRNCIVDRVNKKDELSDLKKQYKEKKLELDVASEELEHLEKRIVDLEKIQHSNLKDEVLISNLLDTARTVANTEGLTEDRIIAIANDRVNYKILLNRLRDEGFVIGDTRKIEKSFTQDKDGSFVRVSSYETKEKTPFQTLMNLLERDSKRVSGGNKMKCLEIQKEKYAKMCGNLDVAYDSFVEFVKNHSR